MTTEFQVLREFFDWVDTDGDGFITIDEIKAACGVDFDKDGVVSDSEKVWCARGWIEKFIQQDINSDQKISFEELVSYNQS